MDRNKIQAKMETTVEEKHYLPPKIGVNSVVLEGNIALQSPEIHINANDWEADEQVIPDTGDIYLPI